MIRVGLADAPASTTESAASGSRRSRESAHAESGHGIYAGGAAGGQVAGESGDGGEEEEHGREGGGVGGGDAEEESAESAGESPGGSDADEHADGGESERLEKNAGLQSLRGGAEGHTDADFLGPLGDGIRDDGVDTERGKNQREEREAAEEEYDKAAGRGGFVHELLESADVGGGEIGIEGLEGFAKARREFGSGE